MKGCIEMSKPWFNIPPKHRPCGDETFKSHPKDRSSGGWALSGSVVCYPALL